MDPLFSRKGQRRRSIRLTPREEEILKLYARKYPRRNDDCFVLERLIEEALYAAETFYANNGRLPHNGDFQGFRLEAVDGKGRREERMTECETLHGEPISFPGFDDFDFEISPAKYVEGWVSIKLRCRRMPEIIVGDSRSEIIAIFEQHARRDGGNLLRARLTKWANE